MPDWLLLETSMIGPLVFFTLRLTVTSTWSEILTKGMPLFIPKSLRLKLIVPLIVPWPDPLFPSSVNVSVSVLVTPRIVKSPVITKVLGPVCSSFFDTNVINGSSLDVEEVFALQLAVLHATSGIYAVCLNLEGQNSRRHIRRRKGERGVPLVEGAF